MGELARREVVSGMTPKRLDTDTRPELEVINGDGISSPDADSNSRERLRLVRSDEGDDVITVRTDELSDPQVSNEEAPTEKIAAASERNTDRRAANDSGLTEETTTEADTAPTVKVAQRPVDEASAPAVEGFDLEEQVQRTADAGIQERIGEWIEASAEEPAADAAFDIFMNKWFAAGDIMHRDPEAELPQPSDEQPPENKELNKVVEVARTVLTRGWEALRTRVNRLFADKGDEVNDRRVFGTSAVLGVVGAFAMAGLLAHQMEDFSGNVAKAFQDIEQYKNAFYDEELSMRVEQMRVEHAEQRSIDWDKELEKKPQNMTPAE